MRVLGIYNIKGGVGKTATAVNLAFLAAAQGRRTLVWDLDPQGASSFYFRVKPRIKGGGARMVRGKTLLDDLVKGTDFDNLDLLPADFSYRHMDLVLGDAKKPTLRLLKLLRPLSEAYDWVILDCPPSISLVSENIFRAADALVVPLIPTTLSVRTLRQLTGFLEGNDLSFLPLLPFFSMVDRRKRMHLEVMRDLPDSGLEPLRTAIPYSSEIERMGVHRAPVGHYAPRSTVALAYERLWEEIRAAV
jgi:cellulose biosynthesis protein BcsQ